MSHRPDPAHPTIHPRVAADARAVVTDPARFAAMPAIRMLAWAALLAERGGRVDQARITLMQRNAAGAAQ